MENKFEKAKKLFASEEYSKAIDVCIEMLKSKSVDEEDKCEFYLLLSKALILAAPNISGDFMDTIINQVSNALKYSKSIEEIIRIRTEVLNAYQRWEKENHRNQYSLLVKKPTFDNYKAILNDDVEVTKQSIVFGMVLKSLIEKNQIYSTHLENLGMSSKDFFNTFPEIDCYEKDDKKRLEFAAADLIVDKAKSQLDEFAHSNSETVESLVKIIDEELQVAEIILKSSSKVNDLELKHDGLLLYARALNLIIQARVYPNGRGRYIYKYEFRKKQLFLLEKTYEEIRELNPNFEAPPLPDVLEESTSAQQNNSGGCYVATAVYGSYDCPQVWTLRRFRDFTLAETWYGRAFIRTYYAISPTLVKWFGNTEWFKNLWKPTLDRMVDKLNSNGVSNKPYNDYPW